MMSHGNKSVKADKSARTEGAEAFFVCLREPLAIAL